MSWLSYFLFSLPCLHYKEEGLLSVFLYPHSMMRTKYSYTIIEWAVTIFELEITLYTKLVKLKTCNSHMTNVNVKEKKMIWGTLIWLLSYFLKRCKSLQTFLLYLLTKQTSSHIAFPLTKLSKVSETNVFYFFFYLLWTLDAMGPGIQAAGGCNE